MLLDTAVACPTRFDTRRESGEVVIVSCPDSAAVAQTDSIQVQAIAEL